MKILELILIVSIAIIAICSVMLAYSPRDELNRLQEEKAALEIQILKWELKAYEEMNKELKSE